MNYKETKDYIQKKVNDFPYMWAFSNQQFAELKKREQVEDKDLMQLNTGAIIRKTDLERHRKLSAEINDLMEKGYKDYNYCLEMFRYELANHEYGYTWDLDDTIHGLGIEDELEKNEIMSKALMVASKEIRDQNRN